MSDFKDYGGRAFPAEGGSDSGLYADPGMFLRDWFAGQVVAAMIGGIVSAGKSTETDDAPLLAKASYVLADAMLEERTK